MRGLPSVRTRTLLLGSAVLIALVGAATAFAAGVSGQPALSVTSPVSQSVVDVSNPSIVVAASDPAGLEGAGTLVIDAASRAVGVAFPESGGHWEDDGCEVYWVPDYDYTHGTLAFTSPTLTDGEHTATLTLRNRLGSSNSVTWSFTVQAPPKYASLTPANGSAVKGTQPAISAYVYDNGTVATTSVTLDGARVASTWNASTRVVSAATPGPLADGDHVVSVAATDTLGLGSSVTWGFSTLKSSAIAFFAPSPSGGSTATVWNPRVSVVCTDSALLTAGTMQLDGATVPAVFQPAADRHSATVSYQTTTIADGTHTAKVTANDDLGFSSTYTWTFDVAAPPQLGTPVPAASGWATTLTPALSVKVAENGAIAAAGITVDDVAVPASYDAATKTIRGVPQAPLADETTHVAVATATDAAGCPATYQWSFKTRATLPAIGAAAPVAGTSAYRPVISASIADTIGVSSIATMTLDGVKVPAAFGYVESGGYWDGDEWDSWWVPSYDYTRATIRYQPTTDLSNGTHTASVEAVNAIGGAATYAWTFEVAAPPQLSAPAPTEGAWVATLTPTVSVKVKANVAIAAVSVTIDGAPASALYDDVAKVLSAVPLMPLADESAHIVTAAVTDSAGQSATTTWSFKTDATPPAAGVKSPAPGTSVAVARPVISLAASDPSGMAAGAVMSIDGASVPCAWRYVESGGYWDGDEWDSWWVPFYDQTAGTASYQPASLADGPHTVTTRVTSASGLAATSTWTFDVAAPPVLSVPNPADGAWTPTLTPAITVKVAENGVVSTTAVFVDGLAVPSTYDAAAKLVRAQPLLPLLDDVSHTVLVTVTDGIGATGSLGWSFKTHAAPPAVTSVAPETSTAVWNPVVAVGVSDLSGFSGSAVMTLDGAAVPASFGFVDAGGYWDGDEWDTWWVPVYDYNRATVRYQPPKLPDGTHSASIRARNNAGSARTYEWTFEVQAPPKLTDAKPLAGSRVATQQPAISLAVAENSAVASVSAAIDGVAVPASYDAAVGRAKVLPAAPLDNDLPHEVRVVVTDAAGNSAELVWSFRVQIHPDMPGTGGGDCTSCHTTYPAAHPMSDCDACHGPGGPVEDCRSCHGDGGHGPGEFGDSDWGGPYDCTRCHQPGGSVPMHPAGDAYHETVRDMSPCRPCHVSSLSVEHYRYTDGAGAALTCGTCHLSADSRVRTAISAGNTDCGGCHDIGTGSHLEQHAEATLSAECLGCHEANVVTEHLSNTRTQTAVLTCDTCHASGDPAVATAIGSGDTGCSTCHTPHGDIGTIHAARDLPTSVQLFDGLHEAIGGSSVAVDCGLCHDVANIAAIHGNQCSTCHPSPRDSFTSWTGSCVQAGCHSTYHANANAGHRTAIDGCDCHDPDDFTVDVSNCGYCHSLVDHQSPITTSDARASYVGPAAVRLSPSDAPAPGGSAVAHTYWTLDGGGIAEGCVIDVPQPASGSATHSLSFRSVDGAGNAEATRTVTFTVTRDATPPTTTSDARPVYFGPATVRLTAADDGSAPAVTYYSLDGGATATGTVVTIPQPATGSVTHTIEYWSVDTAGNVEAHRNATFDVCVDDIAPTTTTNLAPAYRAGVKTLVTLTATDTGSGVAATYRVLNGAAPAGLSFFWVDSTTPLGINTVQYWSVDAVGNVEAHRTATFTVDGAPPVTTSDAVSSYAGPAHIRFTAADGATGSGLAATYVRVDGGAAVAATETTVFAPGAHTIEFWSVDAVGLVETHHTVTFTITWAETIAPVTTSDAAPSYVGSGTVNLSASDEGGSGVAATHWRLNGGSLKTGTTVDVNVPGAYMLEFWSVDGAGNEETPHKTVTFTVTFPPNSGLITFLWSDPPQGSWTYYYVYVYDSQQRLVATAYNETGRWDVYVPVSPQPYTLRAYWYCEEDPGYPVWSSTTALIDAPGKTFTWPY